MTRIIERSTVQNKELFDKLYLVGNDIKKSDELMIVFATQVLHINGMHPMLMQMMHNYCAQYPYTILSNN